MDTEPNSSSHSPFTKLVGIDYPRLRTSLSQHLHVDGIAAVANQLA
jgi:hypothetical protein